MEFIAVLLGLVLLGVVGYAFLAKKARGSEGSTNVQNQVINDSEIFYYDYKKSFLVAGTIYREQNSRSQRMKIQEFRCMSYDQRCMVRVSLRPEPSNPHDEFAVKVLFDRVFVGYVPRFMSEEVSENLNAGVEYQCNFIHVNDDGCLRVGIMEL